MQDSEPSVDALLARGELDQAARRLANAGEVLAAARVYEKLWRFTDALHLARSAGDLPYAVRLAIDAGLPAEAQAIAREVPDDAPDVLRALCDAFAARGLFEDAAHCARRAGEKARAAELFRRAGLPLETARLWTELGRLREAAELLEFTIKTQAPDRAGQTEQAEAQLMLGQLLCALGRPLEAARLLQAASSHPDFAPLALRVLINAVRALGLEHAASFIEHRLTHLEAGRDTSSPSKGRLDLLSRLMPSQKDQAVPERFVVERLIGTGATGRVFLAEDRLLGRQVALKTLSVGATGQESESVARFLREAEAASRLRHPNIVNLLDVDPRAGLLVLEYVPGGTLEHRLATQGRLRLAAVRRLGIELCSALAAAHRAGIVHRDVKPANVYFDAGGSAKLGDFGASHLQDFGQTQTGGLIGTLAYLAPEQVTGSRIGPPADLYALGATLFQALTGRPPFLGPDFVEQHLAEPPPSPCDLVPGLPPDVDRTLLRTLAKTPEERFSSADELAAALRTWPTDDAPRACLTDAPAEQPCAISTHDPASPDPSASTTSQSMVLGPTRDGVLLIAHDPRVDRTLVVERRTKPIDGQQLLLLRRRAQAAGPEVQRILGLSSDACEIHYEHLPGTPMPLAALGAEHPLARIATALQLDPARVILTDSGPVLLLQPDLCDPGQ